MDPDPTWRVISDHSTLNIVSDPDPVSRPVHISGIARVKSPLKVCIVSRNFSIVLGKG